jgi:hypothetical protein
MWKLSACAFLGNSHEETLALHQRLQSKRFAKEVDASLASRQSNFYGVVQTVSKPMVPTALSSHCTADGDIREGRRRQLCSYALSFAGGDDDMERE